MMQNVQRVGRDSPRGFTWSTRRRVIVTTVLLTLVCALAAAPASAVNIVMNFNSGSSAYPSYDPDGAKLTAMMSAVETYYQDIFEASGTLTVDFYYENIDSLAVHNNTGTSSGKPTSCTIRLDTDRTWFFDETPTDNSEFDMTQYLVRDLSADKIAAYYNGTVPSFLEYAYKGNDNGSGPAESSSGYDVFSILLHEMGHGLGMTANVAFWEAWWDEAYDIDPDLVWGNTMETACYSSDDVYHINGRTNMYPYSSTGQRVLPSATDLISIETAADWGDTTLDAKRKEFCSTAANADFNNRDYWTCHKTPDSGDDVWVRDGGDATLSAAITVNNLTIAEGVTVYTGAFRLYADQYATLGDGTNYARVYIQNAGEFQVDYTLTVKNNADVQMDTGSLLDVDSLMIEVGGELIGAGTVDIEDGLINRGTITVSGGNLTIDSDVTVNLDGSSPNDGAGQVYVTGGNFSCNKALTDTFNGYMQVDAGRIATFTEGWRIAGSNALYLNGGTSDATRAQIAGGLFEVAGTVNVNLQARLSCAAEFESAAVVNLTDADDTLYLYGVTTVAAGATFTGAGRFYVTSLGSADLADGVVIGSRLHSNGILMIDEGDVADVTVNAAFSLNSSTATLVMEADGNNSSDLLAVNGAATLGSTLSFSFIDGYTPSIGDTFTLLTYTSRTGTFASILCSGATVAPTYGSTAFSLTVTGLGGDAAQAVPEPGTLALLIGPVALFWTIRRKR